MRPKPAADEILKQLAEDIGKLETAPLAWSDARDSLPLVEGQLFGRLVYSRPVQIFDVGIGIAFGAFVTAEKIPVFKLDAELFFDFANQPFVRRFPFLDMAAEKIPVIGKRNVGLVIAEIDQQSPMAIEQQDHGDLFHA